MATEVGSAYVSIGASTKGLGKAISKEFAGVEGQADKTSSRIMSSIGGAIGGAVKIATGAVAVLGGAVTALALKGGFDRALALDNANAKMLALGYSAADVESVMDSALRSVKGTAFGLGDAASLASQLLAGGVKMGEDLDRALGAAADAAAVANVPLSDMQLVFGQLASGSQLYTQDLLQLQSRGLPVFSWLADSMGVTVDAVRDMVSAGELGFADLQTAIEQNIGGAAKATDSFNASWNNTKAALSRGGAVFAIPALGVMKDMLDAAIPAVDMLSSALEPLATALFDRIAPGVEKAKEALASFASGDVDLGSIMGSFDLGAIMAGIIPAIQSGIAKAADWLANGGVQTLVDGFISGREAMFDAVLQIVPAILDALMTIVPELGSVIVGIVGALAALAPEIVNTLVAMVPQLLETASTVFMTLVDAVITILPTLLTTLASSLPQIITSLLGMVPQLRQTALTLFLSLVDAVVTVLPTLLTTLLTEVLPALLTTLLAMIPELLIAAIDTFIALVDALVEVLPILIDVLIGEVLPTLITTLIDMVPALIQTAIVVFMALVSGLIKVVPKLLGGVWDALGSLIGALLKAAPTLLTAAFDMFQGIGQGFRDAWPAIWDWIKGLPGEMLAALGNLRNILKDAGGKILDGLKDGLLGGFDKVKDTLGSLTDKLTSWKGPPARDATLLTGAGRLIIGSLVDGFDDEIPAVKKKLQGLTSDLAFAGSASLDVSDAGGTDTTPRSMDLTDRTLDKLSALVAARIMQGANSALSSTSLATQLAGRMG